MVTAHERRVIDGLGVFEADEKKVFSQTDADQFARLRGIPLNNDNVPNATVVIYVTDADVKDVDDVFDADEIEEFEDKVLGSHDTDKEDN